MELYALVADPVVKNFFVAKATLHFRVTHKNRSEPSRPRSALLSRAAGRSRYSLGNSPPVADGRVGRVSGSRVMRVASGSNWVRAVGGRERGLSARRRAEPAPDPQVVASPTPLGAPERTGGRAQHARTRRPTPSAGGAPGPCPIMRLPVHPHRAPAGVRHQATLNRKGRHFPGMRESNREVGVVTHIAPDKRRRKPRQQANGHNARNTTPRVLLCRHPRDTPS